MRSRNLRIAVALLLAVVSIATYLYLYQVEPLPANLNDLVSSGMVCMAALAGAIVSTLVWTRYGKGTPPRRIWMHFALALWGWTIAETVWLYEYWIDGAYTLGPADIFWVFSYIFFIVALYGQYALIYRPAQRVGMVYLFLSILAVFGLSYAYALWLSSANGQSLTLETLVNAFYVVADIGLTAGALRLVFVFRDGALGRPWIGLVIFSFSDLLYSWLETNGQYAWSISQGNWLTTLTDTTYLAAYLAIAFGCYLQWLLLFYGPRIRHES
jgi:hypothetical protein